MEELRGKFWTRKEEMVDELNELGFEVLELNDEYVVVVNEEDEEITLEVIVAGNTIAINV